ncbi:MAG: DUF1080 domain-containing protein [Opitutales bacterium]|nr:DUF1080 domain-containing protein [Opitutales bacterium]
MKDHFPLNDWRINDTDTKETTDWTTTESVQLNKEDPKLLHYSADKGNILVNGLTGKTEHIITKEEFGDIELHLEFMISEESNSGIYFMGRYEIQIKDSWNDEVPGPHTSGAVYPRWDTTQPEGQEGYDGHIPRVNASRKPGEWEVFDIIFRAPRFDEQGNKIQDAEFVKVVQNGILIHQDATITGPTRGAMFEDEVPTGPLLLQGDHGPVAYRNLMVTINSPTPATE